MKKTSDKTYETQRKTAKNNENRLLKALMQNPKTFTELKEELGISHTGLSEILNRLVTKVEIKRMEYSKAYELTNKGKKIVKAIPIIQDSIESIMDGKHSYSNVIGKYSLGYKGINLDILSEAQVNQGLAITFEKIVTECFEKSENTIADIPNIVNDKSELKGKMVIAITIDFDDMIKQFLNRNNKTWKKFPFNWENEKDWERLFSEVKE